MSESMICYMSFFFFLYLNWLLNLCNGLQLNVASNSSV